MTIPEKRNPGWRAGASWKSAGERIPGANDSAIRRLRGLLPCIALEARIALDVARDVHFTGGCEPEDGRRLATAYKRLSRAAEIVAEAEREALQ